MLVSEKFGAYTLFLILSSCSFKGKRWSVLNIISVLFDNVYN